MALMEALASGVPTVSTALSGIPELVVDGVTGLLSVPGDAADLNATLAAMLARGPATIDFAEAGRALVVNEFDVHQSASCSATCCRPRTGTSGASVRAVGAQHRLDGLGHDHQVLDR